MKVVKLSFLVLTFLLFQNCVFGQSYGTGHSYSIESPVKKPIEIDVLKNGSQYILSAVNKTHYPFHVEVELTDIINMFPAEIISSFTVYPGINDLATLSAKDPSRPYSYSLNYRYAIGIPCNNIDYEFSYLLPIQGGFEFKLVEGDSTKLKYNFFKPISNDTVYACRKGVVVAVPDMPEGTVRVSDNKSLEVMHGDGTIMVYENIDLASVLVKPEKRIYPGQAIAVLAEGEAVGVKLIVNKGKNQFEIVDNYFTVDAEHKLVFSPELQAAKVSYPYEIITKEFTKKELKLYKKGKLIGK